MQTYYQGLITKGTFTKAVLMHSRQQFRWTRWIFGIALALLLVGSVVMIIQKPETSSMLPGLLVSLVFLSYPWWIPYLQASSYSSPGNIYRAPVKGVIDDIGITMNSETIKTNTLWKAYSHFKHADGMVLLYQGKNNFNIFTREMFDSDEDWKLFLDTLEDRFGRDRKTK